MLITPDSQETTVLIQQERDVGVDPVLDDLIVLDLGL
jgi:hypothetical protein